MSEWTTERLRSLDRAVAEARGWRPFPYVMPGGPDLWCPPGSVHISTAVPLPAVSLGCRETFDLQVAGSVYVAAMTGGTWRAIGEPYDREAETEREAPTPPIAICLAYLAAKGRTFLE